MSTGVYFYFLSVEFVSWWIFCIPLKFCILMKMWGFILYIDKIFCILVKFFVSVLILSLVCRLFYIVCEFICKLVIYFVIV
jgi:hypothetical protein